MSEVPPITLADGEQMPCLFCGHLAAEGSICDSCVLSLPDDQEWAPS